MARSMTGYGVWNSSAEGLSVTVEMRSVNNRFLDLNLRLPRTLSAHEQEVRDIVRGRITRGRVSVFINEEWSETASPPLKVDIAKARRLAEALRRMRDELNLAGEVRIEHLLAVDNLFSSTEESAYADQLWSLAKTALEKALELMLQVSSQEGASLAADLMKRIDAISAELVAVKSAAARQVHLYRDKIRDRLSELLSDARLDADRLETEIALAADRLDISEEIVRLDSHLAQFKRTMNAVEPSGKTLNFLLQEMGREVNTIASKSWMVEISQSALKMKELVEQMREQVQNIE